MKKVITFQQKIVNFLAVKNRCILYGLVFVITSKLSTEKISKIYPDWKGRSRHVTTL